MFRKIMFFFIPIHKSELNKSLCMGMMLFFVLFNYNVLRTLKDALIAPNIGVEAISFIDTYLVIPSSFLFAILYSYLTHVASFRKIFYYIIGFFLVFFLIFAFILYPHHESIHPTKTAVDHLINSKISFLSYNIELSHFKWFFKLYGQWSFSLFCIAAELWGSVMIFLLFWQFANSITKTDEAKRLYPMYSFIGHIGTLAAGIYIEQLSAGNIREFLLFGFQYDNRFIIITVIIVMISLLLTLALFIYLNNDAGLKERLGAVKASHLVKSKPKVSLRKSLEMILTSRYLWLIAILVISYGISINFTESLWKDKAVKLYSDTNSYSHFYGNAIKWIGFCSMLLMLISPHILRFGGWLTGALLTPITMVITSIVFFGFILIHNFGIYIFEFDLLKITVIFGTIHIVLTKGVKYSLFDATKEMTFIPASENIKSRGKAAVDVVGLRFAKAGGAFIQSLLFIVFPSATYNTIAVYLMFVVFIIIFIWIKGVRNLNTSYTALIEKESRV